MLQSLTQSHKGARKPKDSFVKTRKSSGIVNNPQFQFDDHVIRLQPQKCGSHIQKVLGEVAVQNVDSKFPH